MTNQMTLEQAIAIVEDNADQIWLMECRKSIKWLADNDWKFTTDQVWEMLEAKGVSTREPRAMGAAIRSMARAGVIVGTGEYRESRRPECHQRPVKVWAKA